MHCDVETVTIVIGENIPCNITRLDVDQITCLPSVPDEMGSYPVMVSDDFIYIIIDCCVIRTVSLFASKNVIKKKQEIR